MAIPVTPAPQASLAPFLNRDLGKLEHLRSLPSNFPPYPSCHPTHIPVESGRPGPQRPGMAFASS